MIIRTVCAVLARAKAKYTDDLFMAVSAGAKDLLTGFEPGSEWKGSKPARQSSNSSTRNSPNLDLPVAPSPG